MGRSIRTPPCAPSVDRVLRTGGTGAAEPPTLLTVRVRLEGGDGAVDVEIVVDDPEATVGDLCAALGSEGHSLAGADREAGGLIIDGSWRPATTPLLEAGLVHGCTIAAPSADAALPPRPALAPSAGAALPPRPASAPSAGAALPSRPASADGTRLELWCVAGPASGRRWLLPEGPFVVGRGVQADAQVADADLSSRHCRLLVEAGRVWVTDLGSRGGTLMEGERVVGATSLGEGRVLRLGSCCYRVVAVGEDRPSVVQVERRGRMSGTVLLHRPPRPAPPEPPRPVDAPAPEPPEPGLGAIGVAAVAGPVLLAAVMVVLLGSWVFALLALGGALVALATAAESRLRRRRHRRRSARRLSIALTELELQADRHRRQARMLAWASACDPAEAVRRAIQPSTRLWERRPTDGDWMMLMVGVGTVAYEVPLRTGTAADQLPAATVAALARPLRDVPVVVDASDRNVVGLSGHGQRRDALARALVLQAAVTAGPADLAIAIVADPERAPTWDWARWLPHAIGAAGSSGDGPTVISDPDQVRALASTWAAPAGDRALLVVVDGEHVLSARGSPVRRLLGRAAAGIVVTDSADRVPSVASAVVELADTRLGASITRPGGRRCVDAVVPVALSVELADLAARHLARYDDAEDEAEHGGLPDEVGLAPLLGLADLAAPAVARRWHVGPQMRAVLGVTVDGVAEIDLVADGPHVLVAGTTGSGKSELLRDLVMSLALGTDPEHVNFVLVDYKGGSAFDRCAELPHTVGYVTDLDEYLGARALICLEAELTHRERVLRCHDAADIAQLHSSMDHPPLPRLVVVVDEFATMAAELGDFVRSLVGIAQRGRSLGVHLVLATQRPAGSVTEDIRANTNLRICLRVQDERDSLDVLGVTDAARLDRGLPGRALMRLGHGELIAVQSARCTGALRSQAAAPVRLVRAGPGDRRGIAGSTPGTATELGAAVDAVVAAFVAKGMTEPRRPWTAPLPPSIDLDELRFGDVGDGKVPSGAVVVGVADDPRRQRRVPLAWDPDRGNLLVTGRARSGRSTALRAVVAAAAARWSPSELHVYGLDGGGEGLAGLTDLPHSAAVVGSGDLERSGRLVDRLVAELDCRLAGRRPARPRIVLVVDGWIGPGRPAPDAGAQRQREDLARLWSQGPAVGVHVVASADRVGAVESSLTAVTAQKWLLEPAEEAELDLAGIERHLRPTFVAGRVVAAEVGLEAQIGLPAAVLATVATRWPTSGGPEPIGALAERVTVDELPPPQVTDGGWWLPVGIGDGDLDAVGIVLRPAHHLLVAGPRRSGRSTVLSLIASQLGRIAVPTWTLTWPGDGRPVPLAHPLPDGPDLELPDLVAQLAADGGSAVLLVDDAERVGDPAGVLAHLTGDPTCPLSIVAAGRGDALRQAYGHWVREVAASGIGLLLRPDPDLDGDLLGVRLERQPWAVPRPVGRGVLVRDGEVDVLQTAVVK